MIVNRFNRGLVNVKAPADYPPIMTGNVIIPTQVDREDYIKTCQRLGRVSVYIASNGAVLHNCIVTNQVFQDLTFPETEKDLGSLVLVTSDSYYNYNIVIGTLPYGNQTSNYQEGVYQKFWSGEESNFSEKVNWLEGEMDTTVSGKRKSKISINARNSERTAEINLNSNGNVNIFADGELNETTGSHIKSQVIDDEEGTSTVETTTPTEKTIVVGTEDEKTSITINGQTYILETGDGSEETVITINKNTVTIETKTANIKATEKVNLGNGGQPIPLGNNLKSILEKINSNINTLKSAVSSGLTAVGSGSTASGPTGASTFDGKAASVTAPSLDSLNSELSFTD